MRQRYFNRRGSAGIVKGASFAQGQCYNMARFSTLKKGEHPVAHDVTFNLPERELGRADIEFKIRRVLVIPYGEL